MELVKEAYPSSTLSLQSVFDLCVLTLREHRGPDGHCACGNPRGHPCFIDALLAGHPNYHYLHSLCFCPCCLDVYEIRNIVRCPSGGEPVACALVKCGVPYTANCAGMLSMLMDAHDDPRADMDWELSLIADTFNLQYKAKETTH